MNRFKSLAALLLMSSIAIAQTHIPKLLTEGGGNALLATRHTVAIEVIEQVSDGCLPKPAALKSKLSDLLYRAGFKVVDDSTVVDRVQIIAIGYATGRLTLARFPHRFGRHCASVI